MVKLNKVVLIALMLYLSSVANAAVKTILHISLADENDVAGGSHRDFYEKLYKRAFPDRHFVSVVAFVPKGDISGNAHVHVIHKQLREQLAANAEITHLVISQHGSTAGIGTIAPSTYLHGIGLVSKWGVDKGFEEFFAPLLGKFARDAKILLGGCMTFCGSSEDVAPRAEVLLNYLGIPDGQIFGSQRLEYLNLRFYEIDTQRLGILAVLSIVAAIGTSMVDYSDLPAIKNLMNGMLAILGGSLIYRYVAKMFQWKTQAGMITRNEPTGKLVSIQNGKLDSIQSVNAYRNAEAVYGVPNRELCLKTFVARYRPFIPRELLK